MSGETALKKIGSYAQPRRRAPITPAKRLRSCPYGTAASQGLIHEYSKVAQRAVPGQASNGPDFYQWAAIFLIAAL